MTVDNGLVAACGKVHDQDIMQAITAVPGGGTGMFSHGSHFFFSTSSKNETAF